MMIVGIDDSARSPAIGSMFIAIAGTDEETLKEMPRFQDSKKLKPHQIDEIVNKYKNSVIFKHVELKPKVISIWENINNMTASTVCSLIDWFNNSFGVGITEGYIDNCDRTAEHFWERVDRIFPEFDNTLGKDKFTVEHKADENYNIVTLAGIYAKYHDNIQRKRFEETLGFRNTEPLNPEVTEFICENPDSRLIRRNWRTYKRCEEHNFDINSVKKIMGNFKR